MPTQISGVAPARASHARLASLYTERASASEEAPSPSETIDSVVSRVATRTRASDIVPGQPPQIGRAWRVNSISRRSTQALAVASAIRCIACSSPCGCSVSIGRLGGSDTNNISDLCQRRKRNGHPPEHRAERLKRPCLDGCTKAIGSQRQSLTQRSGSSALRLVARRAPAIAAIGRSHPEREKYVMDRCILRSDRVYFLTVRL